MPYAIVISFTNLKILGGVSHKLLIDIEVIDTIPVELHEKFQSLFPKGVIEIDEDSEEIKVANTRKDTLSREVLRHPEFADKVKISRIRDHFLSKSLFFRVCVNPYIMI